MGIFLDKHKIHNWMLGTTIVLFGVLSTIDTPFVLNGLFMNGFWQSVITVLLILTIIELNVLGIRQFPLFKRIYMHAFTVFYFILTFIDNGRVEYLLMLLWVLITSSLFANDYYRNYEKGKEYPRDRMFMIHILSIFFLVLPIADFTIIQDGRMALSGLITGLSILLLITIVLKGLNRKLRPHLEVLLSLIIILPLVCFLLIGGLNYALDDSIPDTYMYEIVELDVDSGARRPTTYEVYFMIEGKKEHIGVSEDIYYTLQIGDEIEVSVYEGFFGFEYLIHE